MDAHATWLIFLGWITGMGTAMVLLLLSCIKGRTRGKDEATTGKMSLWEECPKCGSLGKIDEDQATGKVSILCSECGYHYSCAQ